MISAYPKIFTIGTDYIKDIFKEPIEITEKIDGSQFVFGRVNGEVYVRSKGAQLYFENHQKMFSVGLSYIDSISNRIPDGMIFYCEYLQKPKHNSLKYNRVPKNNLMLFAVKAINDQMVWNFDKYVDIFEIERIPIINRNIYIDSIGRLNDLLDEESALGGPKVEGIVVKNYNRPFLLGGQPIPIMAGKFVSEAYKEVHRNRWDKEEKPKGRMETFLESFKTEARWQKVVQHLAEKNELQYEPRDIGRLIKEVHGDIELEEKENIKEWLYKEFIGQVNRRAVVGLPEWYKKQLANRSF